MNGDEERQTYAWTSKDQEFARDALSAYAVRLKRYVDERIEAVGWQRRDERRAP